MKGWKDIERGRLVEREGVEGDGMGWDGKVGREEERRRARDERARLTEGSGRVILLDLGTLLLREDHVRREGPGKRHAKKKGRRRVSVELLFVFARRGPEVDREEGERGGTREREREGSLLLGSVLIFGSLGSLLVLGGGGLSGCMRPKKGTDEKEGRERREVSI